jgi:hypothetical protein
MLGLCAARFRRLAVRIPTAARASQAARRTSDSDGIGASFCRSAGTYTAGVAPRAPPPNRRAFFPWHDPTPDSPENVSGFQKTARLPRTLSFSPCGFTRCFSLPWDSF